MPNAGLRGSRKYGLSSGIDLRASSVSIAKLTGCTPQAVSYWRKKMGLAGTGDKRWNSVEDKIRGLPDSVFMYLGNRYIASKLRCSVSAVRNWRVSLCKPLKQKMPSGEDVKKAKIDLSLYAEDYNSKCTKLKSN